MFRRTFFKVAGLSTAALALGARAALPSERHYNQDRIPTGLPLLDQATAGGIQRNSLVLIVGSTASGKTAIMNRLLEESRLQRIAIGSFAPPLEVHDDLQDVVMPNYVTYEDDNGLLHRYPSRAKAMYRMAQGWRMDGREKGVVHVGAIQTRQPMKGPYTAVSVIEPNFGTSIQFVADLILKVYRSERGTHSILVKKNRWGQNGFVCPFKVVCKNGSPFAIKES